LQGNKRRRRRGGGGRGMRIDKYMQKRKEADVKI
jgi:hypothetical protein